MKHGMAATAVVAQSILTAILVTDAGAVGAAELPDGYWSLEDSQRILEQTETVRLAPDLSELSPGEQAAVAHLLRAGAVMQRVYEEARHPQALVASESLAELHVAKAHPRATANLLDLYRLFQGPIATTLENARVPFLPVAPETAARNVYPAGASREEIDAYLERHPESRAEILAERSVVRRTTPQNLDRDLVTLSRYPELDTLHPFLLQRLETLRADPAAEPFYAVPQSVAWAAPMTEAYRELNLAARAADGSDPEFARYLRNRARDLLSDDYESGDASWVTGEFQRLNAQIGSYETYDDALYGVKAFASLSILKRNAEASAALRTAIRGLQAIEDALPYENHRRVREDIPVGVYEVVADFGQSRGRNTATILPNDPLFTKRYGRTILLRENIMRHPVLFANSQAAWQAVVAPAHAADLSIDGEFHRTLWHEIGHYLGVDRDRHGRALDVALESTADSYEEMKSDLVSLFAAPGLRDVGYYDEVSLRAVEASGILRTLQHVRPRTDQPYQQMQLMQFNWFLDQGLIRFDERARRLEIDYSRYHSVVDSLLEEVLAIQYAGDLVRARAFMERWTGWRPDLHDVIAATIRDSQRFRYVLMRYAVLGE